MLLVSDQYPRVTTTDPKTLSIHKTLTKPSPRCLVYCASFQAMQSFRQYREIKSAVARQVETGKVVNVSNEKVSVLSDAASEQTSTVTAGLREGNHESGEIIVGWEGPQGDNLQPVW